MSGLSNYPPGVSGNEWEIAGPDTEEEAEYDCQSCGKRTAFTVFTFRGDKWADCDVCGYRIDLEPDGPDPDDERDLRMDSKYTGDESWWDYGNQ